MLANRRTSDPDQWRNYLIALHSPTLLVALRGGTGVTSAASVDGAVAVFTSPAAARHWLAEPDWELVAHHTDDLVDGLVAVGCPMVVDPGTPLRQNCDPVAVRNVWEQLKIARPRAVRGSLGGGLVALGVGVLLLVVAALGVAGNECYGHEMQPGEMCELNQGGSIARITAEENAASNHRVFLPVVIVAGALSVLGLYLLIRRVITARRWARRPLPLHGGGPASDGG